MSKRTFSIIYTWGMMALLAGLWLSMYTMNLLESNFNGFIAVLLTVAVLISSYAILSAGEEKSSSYKKDSTEDKHQGQEFTEPDPPGWTPYDT